VVSWAAAVTVSELVIIHTSASVDIIPVHSPQSGLRNLGTSRQETIEQPSFPAPVRTRVPQSRSNTEAAREPARQLVRDGSRQRDCHTCSGYQTTEHWIEAQERSIPVVPNRGSAAHWGAIYNTQGCRELMRFLIYY